MTMHESSPSRPGRRSKEKSEETDEDKELQNELRILVDAVTGNDMSTIGPSLNMLKHLIRNSTTSMTSVPKPLKYLAPYYDLLKISHEKMSDPTLKKNLADVISLLAIGTAGGEQAKTNRECLKYCLLGNSDNVGDWGHEYIRQLEKEIVQQWDFDSDKMIATLLPLVINIVIFNCEHNGEIQACDLLMEIDQLNVLPEFIAQNNYQRVCMYLTHCGKYVDNMERMKILKIVYDQYLKFGEYTKALVTAIQMDDGHMVNEVFKTCKDRITLFQMAFICARQMYAFDTDAEEFDEDLRNELTNILSNYYLSNYYLILARELDIMEPKAPEEVFKTWLETTSLRMTILGEQLDSAKQNLASSFVNGFVNAGFGCDKLLMVEGGSKWIYRNKEHGMLSAAASLGLLHLWDIDGGLTPIDKYLYSDNNYIKSGSLLALGIVNSRVRSECDPALALLGDYVNSSNEILQTGAVLGLALAYAGTHRTDVTDLILRLVTSTSSNVLFGIASLACGIICIGQHNSEIPSTILNKLIELNHTDDLKSPHVRLACLGLSLCYFGAREDIEAPTEAISVLEEPFKSFTQTTLLMCAYAGTGDVLIIQELLRNLGDKLDVSEAGDNKKATSENKEKETVPGGSNSKLEWDYSMGQSIATLALAVIAMGEDIGTEMSHRIFGHLVRYGDPSVRRVVPLAISLASVSNPQLSVIDVLTKYSHDSDVEVAANAIFGLGLTGAGTNNARLAASLRQLAVFHNKNPTQLFMVRIAQGLVHLGKGTLTLNPMHTDRMLLDPVALAGLMVPLFALLDPTTLILNQYHYLLYCLSPAMQPRWLLTLDASLNTTSVTVRVGQAVDVIGKAGTPKTIAGIHTHSTPVLLAASERAELAADQFESLAPALDGICVLKKVPEGTKSQ